jgi:hypothetical protein
MKLFVKLATSEVTPYVAGQADKNNGQHEQLTGSVIANVTIDTPGRLQFDLLHPDTKAATGHVDVIVVNEDDVINFYSYGMTRFSLDGNLIEDVFPTGGWSLVQVMVALEEYLHRELRLPKTLQKQILKGL